ncbi:hypothetical protein VTN00DRAFT_1807 [Thermoascus crustaceus]|uniref:uncharacterized protein n=1 Tax=Thermoascus crustaceus TaxID=5088 RepID=UPI00374442BB
MSDVRSKNLYELLGNDPELDPDRPPSPPTRAIEKPLPRVGKREAPKEAPTAPRGGAAGARGGRGGRVSGNEEAFRDRHAGSYNNRNRPIDEQKEAQRRGVKAREDRGGRVRNDRHPRTGETDTHKKIDQGWGATRGESRWNDEKAGEAIAEIDENEPQTPGEGADEEKEPADKTKSYADYLAELAEKKREDLGVKEARAPNEGANADKKWANVKEFKRDEDEEAYIKGVKEEKTKREKQRKEKTYLDVDMRFVEQPRGRENGPRGRGRGGRGRGEFRGNGPRGGGRGGAPTPTVDEKNFPSLGSK